MTLKIKRHEKENQGVSITPSHNYWLAVVCNGLTLTEHYTTKEEIEEILDMTAEMDLYFTRNFTSLFLFDVEDTLKTMDNETLRETIKLIQLSVNHNCVYNNNVYGTRMEKLSVTTSKKEMKVSTKYQILMSIPRV